MVRAAVTIGVVGMLGVLIGVVALKALAPPDAATATDDQAMTTTPSGLKYLDVGEGTGPEAKAGDLVDVHYTGRLKDGKKFESSLDRGQPYSFRLGAKQVIAGWDEGIVGMKAGGKRKLVIPPELGYGARGSGSIPPNAELHFDVELLRIRQ